MNIIAKKRLLITFFILCVSVALFSIWEIYVARALSTKLDVVFTVQKGSGYEDIAQGLAKQGIIKNNLFFRLYIILSGQYAKLQAGTYNLSSSMSVANIAKKMVSGDVIKNNITIIEGWNLQDIAKYLQNKNLYSQKDFLSVAKKDFSSDFEFLEDLPAKTGKSVTLSLEGYLFPDTYEIYTGQAPEEFIKNTLSNFDKKLTPDLRQEIKNQHKSIFQIITMASILEKEVQTLEDKKVVSGILWKRIENKIPLQVDATISYITKSNSNSYIIKNKQIDSPYNTYKYAGLPLGPICNPGMNSILAAMYPKKSDYWYYLSANGTGKTIFSKTLEEHNVAVIKYLRY